MAKIHAIAKNIPLTILKWAAGILGSLILLLILTIVIARSVTYFSNRITGENGVDEGIYVTLCGQEQYLLIRGEDVANPVIIWLHGGPAGSDAYVNYTFQKHLVADYTIVNWDQRGCGRTYFRNRDADLNNKTATFEQAQADLDALVDYVAERFKTEQIILVGHSYGTMLASRYALDHPEKIAAYIGVGQVVTMESDLYSYAHALELARAKGDDTAEMEAAYETFLQDRSLTNMMTLRGKVSKYHTAEKQVNTIWLGIASPYMGIDDLRWFFRQMGSMEAYFSLNQQLFDYIMTTDVRNYGLTYQVPVGFLTGSDDWTTPAKYTQDYFDQINAPQKQIHYLEGSGHAPQYDSPEEFCSLLKAMLDEYLIHT